MPKGKRIEPLDLAELENNPSLKGMFAFRESPRSPSPETLTPIGRPPIGPTHPATKPAGQTLSGEATPELCDVLARLAEVSRAPKSRGKILRATRVEDGHSATQDALYWFLWRTGQQVNGSRSRFVQAGYGQIQASLGIDRSNVQDAIRELQKKLSIRVYKASTVGSATIYEVFSCEEILVKRKTQGLVWVRKFGTRRADLLSSPDDEQAESIAVTPIGPAPIASTPGGLTDSVGVTPTHTIGLMPIEGIGVTPIHSVKEVNSNRENKTSSALAILIRSVQEELGPIDDVAAHRILDGCYQKAPDATNEELEHFSRLQASRIRNSKRVDNKIGLLITQLPKCFEGESFRQFRQAQQQRGRESQVGGPSETNQYHAVLNDPNASEPEKRLALALLAGAPGGALDDAPGGRKP